MDDLGFNKIAGAVLATGLGMLLLMKVPGVLIAHADDSIAYDGGYVPGDTDDEPTPEDLPFPQQDWIDAMDAAKGAKVFNKCKACHNAEVGGGNGTGPALYGVVENDIAAQEGFKYSSALTNLPDNWTYEALDSYLAKPSNYAPGTNMTFFGLKKASDRAAVIEYLRVADPAPDLSQRHSKRWKKRTLRTRLNSWKNLTSWKIPGRWKKLRPWKKPRNCQR